MSGIYWTLTALELGQNGDRLNQAEIVEFVRSCQHECGGFGASVNHDPHLLYTLSAVQILVTYDAVDRIDVEKAVQFIAGLQQVGFLVVKDDRVRKGLRFNVKKLIVDVSLFPFHSNPSPPTIFLPEPVRTTVRFSATFTAKWTLGFPFVPSPLCDS